MQVSHPRRDFVISNGCDGQAGITTKKAHDRVVMGFTEEQRRIVAGVEWVE